MADRTTLVFRWLTALAVMGILAVLAHGFLLDLHFSDTARTRHERSVASMLGSAALLSFVVLLAGYALRQVRHGVTVRKVCIVLSLVVLVVAEADALRRLADTPV